MKARAIVIVSVMAVTAPRAHGQGLGTCSGMLAGTVGLSVPDSKGSLQSIQAASVPFVFGNAECVCNTKDINAEIALTAALPSGMLGTAEVWVGTGCDNFQIRTQINSTACEKVAVPDIALFTVGSSNSRIEIPIPAAALMSPNLHTCTTPAITNSVFVFLYSDPAMPFATCTLPLSEVNQPPAPATRVSASGGNGAVTVSWSPPPSTQTQPSFFQILCADASGAAVPHESAAPAYSVCLPGPPPTIARRALPTSGSQSTSVAPAVHGTFAELAPAFICSSEIPVSGTSYARRISGLTNGTGYQFVVLSIDRWGNAAPSDVVMATPQGSAGPPMQSGGGGGGCSIGATSRSASPLGLLLLVLLGLVGRARRKPYRFSITTSRYVLGRTNVRSCDRLPASSSASTSRINAPC
jgi:hypothetical protein